jgi:hypothetical protein
MTVELSKKKIHAAQRLENTPRLMKLDNEVLPKTQSNKVLSYQNASSSFA